MTRTLSIAINENTYQDLRERIGVGKISSFVNQAVQKELQELIQAEKRKKEALKKKLITAYQREVKNEEFQKEMSILENAAGDSANDE
jgi:rRNA-processing protein FCF1